MAELNDQYLNSLKVALFQFTRESSNFTSVLTEVFDNLNTSSTKSSKQIDNSTKSVKGFGDAISSSSTYLKDFKTYVSNNSKNIVESSKAVKEYTSQLAELKQKSVDINRNWGALNSALKNNIDASESSTRQHEINKAILSKEYAEADQRFKDARNISGALASDTLALGEAAGKLKKQLDDLTNLQIGKIDLNAQIKKQNQELYTNIYDTFGNSLLKIDSLINEKTSAWKGLKGGIDTLAKDAFKDTSLNISKEFQKNGIPGLHDYNKALAEALLSLERTGGVIDESNFAIIDKFQQFAEKVGDSSDAVKNINNALNAHVESIVKGAKPEEAKTSINGDIVNKLTESYQGNIEALEKFSKSINKTFTKHQIAFSTIIDKQLSEQSNAYGKFIYNFGKAAAQGGDGGTEGMTNAINEFTGTMRSGLLPALKSLALTSKDFITSEAKALFNGIQLDRTASLQLQEGEQETLRKLTDTKDIWSGMGGGSAEYTQTQLDSQKALKEVIGVDSKQRTKAFEDITHALRSTGVLDTSGNEKANTQNVDKVLYGIQDVVKGGMYNAEQAVEIFKNTAQSTEYLKVASTMDKKRRDAQKDEILTTMKFASALNMSAESAKAFAVAVATAGSNLSPQQMISNVATTGQAQNILDFYAKELGVKSENTDADRERMTAIEQLPAGMRSDKDKAFFNEFLLKMVKTNADVQQKLTESANEARDKGDIEGQKKYASLAVQASNQFDTAIAGYSGAEKDIIDAYVKQYPTIDQEAIKKNLKDGESITQAIVRSMDEKKEKTNADLDTKYNNTIVNLSSLAAYWDAFTKNIIGANIGNLATLLFNIAEGVGGIMFAVSGFKKILSVLGVGGAIAEGGAAVAGAAGAAGVAEVGIGALAAAALPEILAVLAGGAGIAMLAYGAKGLYDHAVGNDVIYKADRGDAIHGIVDVNNLDIYTNQVTDAIDTQTQELLKGFTTIMGNHNDVKKSIEVQTEIINDNTKPLGEDTSIPFQGYKPYNPPNGTNIEQPTGVLPSNQINNADISLALDDLKTFLSKELIVGMLSRFDELITNTGDTAKNTGDGGTLGNLVAALTKPASTPFVRGRVEDAATITTS